MKKTVFYFFYLLLGVFTLQSCDQEFDYIMEGEEMPLVGNKIIKKITSTQGGQVTNYMVENGLVTNINASGNGALFNFDISYNGNGKPSSATTTLSSDIIFNYNDAGKLIAIVGTEEVDSNDAFLQFFNNEIWMDTEWDVNTVFEYNNEGKISKSKCTRLIDFSNNEAADGVEIAFTTTYTYAGDNYASYKVEVVTQVVGPNPDFYQDDPVPYTNLTLQYDNLVYDNKLSAFTNISPELLYAVQSGHFSGVGNGNNNQTGETSNGLVVGMYSLNNLVSGTLTSTVETTAGAGNMTNTSNFQFDYVYDEEGYPSSSSPAPFSYNYEYQPYTP